MSSHSRKRTHDAVDGDIDERKMPAVEEMVKISDTVKKPKVGMVLEARDTEYLWCPARVVKVEKVVGIRHVTVHYEGWGDSYDECIPWKSERLVPIYTFTKKVKCFVNILYKAKFPPPRHVLDALPPGAKRTYCNLWPCMVQLRMPHPIVEGLEDEQQCLDAEAYLRGEVNVFVQPYAPHLLPEAVRSNNTLDSGRWVNAKRLRPWTNDPSKLGVLPKNFQEAFDIADRDAEVTGILPTRALELGSLLTPTLRVHTRAGAQVRDGSLQEVSEIPKHLQDEQEDVPPEVVEIRQQDETVSTFNQGYNLRTMPPRRPTLPPPIEITTPIYPNCGVKQCTETNGWTASVCVSGNELFLGTFPTQTQAYQATRVAAGQDGQVETDLKKAQLADLRAVPIEAIIEAAEKHFDPAIHTFSLHHYTVEQIRFEASQYPTTDAQEEVQGISLEHQAPTSVTDQPRKNKRKGKPRKVDLERHCYV